MDYKIKWAYMAGALDGDGSFSLIKNTSSAAISPLYYPMIQFANCNEDIVEMFASECGTICAREEYTAKDGILRKASYQWKLEKSGRTLPFLEEIIPFLIIKKERAQFLRDYIIDNPFIRGSNRLDDDILRKRENAYLKMRSFNDNPDINGHLLSLAKRKNNDDELFWAYVAGLMDTDGSFSLKKENRKSGGSKSPVYSAQILLSMVDCRGIYYLMNNFIGGSLLIVKSKTSNTGFCYRFNITSRKNAIIFLRKCIPFLFIKRKSALKLLEFCESMKAMNGKKGVSKEELEIREKYYKEMLKLNDGVYKSPLIGLKTLPGYAEGNKAEAAKACTVNAVSEETSKEDAVL